MPCCRVCGGRAGAAAHKRQRFAEAGGGDDAAEAEAPTNRAKRARADPDALRAAGAEGGNAEAAEQQLEDGAAPSAVDIQMREATATVKFRGAPVPAAARPRSG